MSLSKKIIFTFGIIFIILLVVNNYFFNHYIKTTVINKSLNNIISSSNFFNDGLKKAFELGLQIEQLSDISDELERFKKRFNEINEILIVDEKNLIIANNSYSSEKQLGTNDFPDNLFLSKISDFDKIEFNNFYYLIYKYNEQSRQKKYYLIIKINRESIQNQYSDSIWNYLIYSICIITSALIAVIIIMFFFITKPFKSILLQLNDIINLKKYDLKLILYGNNFEFKILVEYINNLLEIVHERELQLVGYNEKLNEEIKKRTEKLNSTILELKLVNEKLVKADHIKDDFLSVVTHELKTPLTTIRAYVETMQNGIITEESEKIEFYQIIIGEITRLTRLINNVLDLNKYERNQLKLNLEKCNLSEILKQIITGALRDAKDKNITLTKNISETTTHNIVLDKDRITQVLFNIINNAVKFNVKNGSVEIETSKAYKHQFPQFNDLKFDNYIMIKVSDTGIGIKSEKIAKIWEKFGRVSEDYYEGTGLGLAVSKGIIEILKGKIWVESVFGKGSVFYIILPDSEEL
ncbi:HAMP domain-containing histidine kinase [Candidatus Dependentiae bacterium]|nr:HAMP domain-containing histidine kinase [Candidatus Dependentiae bacterium]